MTNVDSIAQWSSPSSAGCLLKVCCLTGLLVACTASEPVERVFVLQIANQQVAEDMRVLRVTQDDSVKLKWSSDRSLQLHLHGYDIEKTVTPGQVTEFAFKAHASGRFPINVHANEPSQEHTERVLVYLEVYPR